MSRILITAGIVLVIAGLMVRLGVPLGRLPGDILIQRGGGTFYFPLVTCLLVSVVLSLVALILKR